MRRFLALALALWMTSACARTKDTTPDTPGASKPEPTRAVPGSRTLEGVLTYTPIEAVKSVEAYLGVELTLTAGSETVVLGPSGEVSRDALVAAAGKRVKVTCVPREPVAPSPDESYPTEPDGSPMKRPGRCEVLALSL